MDLYKETRFKWFQVISMLVVLILVSGRDGWQLYTPLGTLDPSEGRVLRHECGVRCQSLAD